MKKIETIWHEILHQSLYRKQFRFTQQDLARKFSYSLSTVNHALSIPDRIGAIRKESKFFILSDYHKLLYYWASKRNLSSDIIYSTHYEDIVSEIEGLAPPEVTFGLYTAARKILGEPPADYDCVYFYSLPSDLTSLQNRFPQTSIKRKNIIVLKGPPLLFEYGHYTSLPQTFVDIWNLKDWYGRDFTLSLEEKINGLLSP